MKVASTNVRRWWAVLHLAWFGLLWALPAAYAAASGKWLTWASNHMQTFYRLSALFAPRSAAWHENYIQVKSAGTPDWVTVNVLDYDHLDIYGYGNRISRMIADFSGNGERGRALQGRIAQFIARRHQQMHPDLAPLAAVRFVAARWEAGQGSKFMSEPPGRWAAPPLQLISPKSTYILSTHALGTDGSVIDNSPSVGGAWLTDGKLRDTLKSRKLTGLNIAQAKITREVLPEVWKHKSLQTLDVSGHRLTNDDMREIARLPFLRELNANGCGLSPENVKELAACTGLRSLSLDLNTLDDSITASLAKLPNLESLKLNQCGLSGAVLDHLPSWPVLRELHLAAADPLRPHLIKIRRHTRLQSLNLSDTRLSGGDLLYLQRLPGLETLYLDGTEMNDQQVEKMRWLPSLRHLSLEDTPITQKCLQILGQHTQIKSVYFDGEWKEVPVVVHQTLPQ